MQYILSRQFEKDFAKLPARIKTQAIDVLATFVENPASPQLRTHPLMGRWVGHFSINITGDTRAIYFIVEKDIVRFVAIGSHGQLYGK